MHILFILNLGSTTEQLQAWPVKVEMVSAWQPIRQKVSNPTASKSRTSDIIYCCNLSISWEGVQVCNKQRQARHRQAHLLQWCRLQTSPQRRWCGHGVLTGCSLACTWLELQTAAGGTLVHANSGHSIRLKMIWPILQYALMRAYADMDCSEYTWHAAEVCIC